MIREEGGMISPYALIMSDEQVQKLRNRIQTKVDSFDTTGKHQSDRRNE